MAMERWEVPAPPEEGGTARDDEDWGTQRAEQRTARRAEEAALRRALGLESAFGFYIVDASEDVSEDTAMDAMRRVAPALIGSIVPVGREGDYPCLEGRRYTGCLGLACPLERCWTGGPTISQARALERRARVSTALYLPGAPCHGCAAVMDVPQEKTALGLPALPASARAVAARRAGTSVSEAPVCAGEAAPSSCVSARTAPAAAPPCADARTAQARPRHGVVPGAGEGGAAKLGDGGAAKLGDGGVAELGDDSVAEPGDESVAEATGRVDCSRGLWAHAISVSAFVSKRIPMLYEAEPALCPGFAARSRPHPAVAAHLERRREQARRQRAEQRER